MQVEIYDFCDYPSAIYNFAPGITHLEGASESGKTTIFRAIAWCLFGYKASTSIIPWYNPTASTRVVLRILSMGLEMERTRSPAILKLRDNGYLYEGPSADNRILSYFGSRNLWECSCYLAQQRDNLLMELGSGDQSGLLEEAFLSFNIKPITERLRDIISGYNRNIDYTKSLATNLQTTMNNSSQYMGYIGTDFESLGKEEAELRVKYNILTKQSSDYQSYISKRQELEMWLNNNTSLQQRLDAVRKYNKWKLYTEIKSGITHNEYECKERIKAYEEANTKIPNIRSQLDRIAIQRKLDAIPKVDEQLLQSEQQLRLSLQLQGKYNTVQEIYKRYNVSSIAEMNTLLIQQTRLNEALSISGNVERLRRLESLSLTPNIINDIRNYEESLRVRGVDIAKQRIALEQVKYTSIYSRIKPDLIDEADVLKSKYTSEQLHLCLSKLECPHCSESVSLQGGKLVKSLPLTLSPELLQQIDLARSVDKSLRNVYNLFTERVQLMVRSEDDLKRIEFLQSVPNPGMSSKDYYDAERIQNMIKSGGPLALDIRNGLNLIQLRSDLSVASSYIPELASFTSIDVTDVNQRLLNIAKGKESVSLRKHYESMLPNIAVTDTEENLQLLLKKYTESLGYSVSNLYDQLQRIDKLKQLGEAEEVPFTNDNEATLIKAISEYDMKKDLLDKLVPVSPADLLEIQRYETRLRELSTMLSAKPAVDVLKPVVNQYNETYKTYDNLMQSVSVSNGLYHKMDETKRMWIANRLSGVNESLKSKMHILNLTMRKSHSIYISPFTWNSNGDIKGKPSINIYQEGVKVERISSLCGGQHKMVNLVLTLAMAELSPFPFVLLDEPLTSSDEAMTMYVLEHLKFLTNKSIIMTTHRTSSVQFDFTVICQRSK
jgi:hypothetical protein